MRKRELNEILLDIRNEIPDFNREELLDYTKWIVPRLYNSLKNQEELNIKCDSGLIDRLNEQKLRYRITKDMDRISIQYAEIYDNVKKDDQMHIQVYLSVYFFDDVKNNKDRDSISDKYWNDIWVVTYKKDIMHEIANSNCKNCGAIMKYNKRENLFQCEYCGNVIHKSDSKWEMVDIEVLS